MLRRVSYSPGQPFRPSALERSRRNLEALPIVQRAAVDAVGLPRRDTVVETRVNVEAGCVHGVQVEGTLSSAQCLALGGTWQHRYFLGGPRVFAIGGTVSNLFAAQSDGSFPCGSTGTGEFGELDYSIRTQLWQPALFGTARNTLTASAYVRRASSPNVFIEQGFGGRLQAARDLGGGWAGLVGLALERNELDASGFYFCANYEICSAGEIRNHSGRRWLTPLELDALHTSLESGSAAAAWRTMARASFSVADAATGSDYGFGRAVVEVAAARAIGRAGELAARTRLGGVFGDELLPPQLRLYSGGVNSVRGVGWNLLGPKVLVARNDADFDLCQPGDAPCAGAAPVDPADVIQRPTGGTRVVEANLEARLALTGSAQLAAFADFGWLSRGGGTSPLGGPEAEALVTPGVGLRILTSFGPFRVDIGYDPSGPRVYPLVKADSLGGVATLGRARFDPHGRGDPSRWSEFWRRLQVQVGTGPPF